LSAGRREIVVFLGPSLPVATARRRLQATYLPPVAQGDVLRVLARRPRAIGIVDGAFERVPSVWHKEILVALQAGVYVAGAASMGALRAVELGRFGMVGVGEVHAAYRAGTLEDDDEVAVAHADAEHGWRPASEAMVDVRDRCRQAAELGVVGPGTAAALLESAKTLYYPRRIWPAIVAGARSAAIPAAEIARFERWLPAAGPGVKTRDALALLDHLAGVAGGRGRRAARPAWRLERTEFLAALEQEVARQADLQEAGRSRRPAAGLEREALLQVLVEREAARLAWVPAVEAVQAAADDFRRRRGLLRRVRTRGWLAGRGLDEERFLELMRGEALLAALSRRHYKWEVEQRLPDVERLRGPRREPPTRWRRRL
jgi:hypothetical protein